MKKFRERVLAACTSRTGNRFPGLSIRVLSQNLHYLDASPQGRVPVDNVRDELVNSIGIEIDINEINSIIRSFSRNNCDEIILIELIEFLRGGWSQWRHEFVTTAFNSIMKNRDEKITEESIINSFDAVAVSEMFRGVDSPEDTLGYLLDSFHVYNPEGIDTGYSRNDFMEYYRDVSCEVPNEDDFEQLITSSWHVQWK